MKRSIFWLTYIWIFTLPVAAFAHGGEDHSEEKKKAAGAHSAHFTTFAVSPAFEVVLYYDEIKAGKETVMKLFLSDFATNAPISNAKIDIALADDASKKFEIHELDSGVYSVKGIFPANKNYSLTANILSAQRSDLMLIKNVEVGKTLPVEETAAEHENGFSINYIFYMLGGLLLGLLLMYFFMRKRKAKIYEN